MKKLVYTVLSLVLLSSCKQTPKTEVIRQDLSISEKIANAHGFENWKNVSEIQFTFNVDKDSTHFDRTWYWKPKTNKVTAINKKDTISYSRIEVDSTLTRTDGGFINDKYWLLVPFQLVWDKGTTISEPIVEEDPISKLQRNKITLTYSNKGGYTPGDAYDIYYDDDFLIRSWVFRKGNQAEPSMITTFENYQTFNGIKLALEHKKSGQNWNLNFTNVKVITD